MVKINALQARKEYLNGELSAKVSDKVDHSIVYYLFMDDGILVAGGSYTIEVAYDCLQPSHRDLLEVIELVPLELRSIVAGPGITLEEISNPFLRERLNLPNRSKYFLYQKS